MFDVSDNFLNGELNQGSRGTTVCQQALGPTAVFVKFVPKSSITDGTAPAGGVGITTSKLICQLPFVPTPLPEGH